MNTQSVNPHVTDLHTTSHSDASRPYLIDTHCHLHDRSAYDFAISRNQKCDPADYTPDKLLQNAHSQGISQIICIGTTHADSLAARDFATAHAADGIFWSYGIHPEEATSAKDAVREELSRVSPTPVAIGEVGLDYHSADYNRDAQLRLLESMLDLASHLHLPLIFHVRDAFADFWPVIDNARIKRAVVHSFSDSPENLHQALNHDFYIGINGLATFADLYPDGLPPLSRTLLETDAPFLAPRPHRGLPNQSAYIRNIADFLAAEHHTTLEAVAATTTKNARELFKLP